MKKNHFVSHLVVVKKISAVKNTRKKEHIAKNVLKYKLVTRIFECYIKNLSFLIYNLEIASKNIGILGIESLNLHIQ
jgi:hypothetical protein